MSIYQRPLRPDELMHANYKYIDKVRTKNGNWRYIYNDGARYDLNVEDSHGNSKRIAVEYHTDKNVSSKRKIQRENPSNKNASKQDRMERNYHGDEGIERHNSGLYGRDAIKTYRKEYNDYLEEEGFDSRRAQAARKSDAKKKFAENQRRAKAAKNPINKTLSTAKKAVDKGRSFIKSLFG